MTLIDNKVNILILRACLKLIVLTLFLSCGDSGGDSGGSSENGLQSTVSVEDLRIDISDGSEYIKGNIYIVDYNQLDLVDIADWDYCCGYIWRAVSMTFEFFLENQHSSVELAIRHMPLRPEGYDPTVSDLYINDQLVKTYSIGDGYAEHGLDNYSLDITQYVVYGNTPNRLKIEAQVVKFGLQGIHITAE